MTSQVCWRNSQFVLRNRISRERLMKNLTPTSRLFPLLLLFSLLSISSFSPVRRSNRAALAQTRERIVASQNLEVIKTDIDLVTLDALVLQKDTARVVGDLTRADFQVMEDGKLQEITHFNQGTLPLSVLLLIDRGGCLDPYNTQVRHAAIEALARLKLTDEVGVMTYHNDAELLNQFIRYS